MKILIVIASLIVLGSCGESSVSINVKSSINTISDKFISYETNFSDLIDAFLRDKSVTALSSIAPAYMRLRGLSSYLKQENATRHQTCDVASLFHALNNLKITPVIVVDYNIASFEALSLLREMKTARNLKINECVWQLGDNEMNFGSRKYLDDLKTLKLLCDSVNKEHLLSWSVAGDSSLADIQSEKISFDVVGFESARFSTIDIISKSNSIRPKSQLPAWVTISQSNDAMAADSAYYKANNESCNRDCLMSGLLHAQVLGDAARKGFQVAFLEKSVDEMKTKSLKDAVSTLHKKLVGSKVFNVRVTKSSQDGKLMNLYSYCSKKTDGAITLMGINFSNMRAKFNVRISSSMDSNAIIMQYLLSASDGHVLLNNERFSSDVTPSYKFKKLSKFSISLVLPPFSMAFWTIKNAKVNECLNISDAKTVAATVAPTSSSSDQLLKKLVANEFNEKRSNSIDKARRSKRQIGGTGPFLPTHGLDFPELPVFKFPSLMMSSSNQKPIKDSIFGKGIDVYKAPQHEVNPLKSSENTRIPEGDVYLLIDDGKQKSGFDDDYVVEYEEAPRPKANRKKNGNRIVFKERTEAPETFMAYDSIDASRKSSKKSSKKVAKPEPVREIGELFEAEKPSSSRGRGDQSRSESHNIELQTVIRELEPTYRQSKSAMLAARRKWDKQQIMELLKDAEIEEEDRAKLHEAEDFEVIDLTENSEHPNYEEYEEDDDGFFNENLHQIRTRRSADLAKNEIPKHGYHVIDDDEEDEESLESLMDDVHVFLQPRHANTDESKANIHESFKKLPTTESPLTVKAINYFSQSLNDAIDVAHKTLIGWWYVFNPNPTNVPISTM